MAKQNLNINWNIEKIKKSIIIKKNLLDNGFELKPLNKMKKFLW